MLRGQSMLHGYWPATPSTQNGQSARSRWSYHDRPTTVQGGVADRARGRPDKPPRPDIQQKAAEMAEPRAAGLAPTSPAVRKYQTTMRKYLSLLGDCQPALNQFAACVDGGGKEAACADEEQAYKSCEMFRNDRVLRARLSCGDLFGEYEACLRATPEAEHHRCGSVLAELAICVEAD